MRRPAEVKQDVRQMEERQRVNMILQSKAFRQELEKIVIEQMKTGPQGEESAVTDQALQQLSEMFPNQSQLRKAAISQQGVGRIIPIADFSGVDVRQYEKGEKLLRSKLAACCRLMDVFGWSQGEQSFVSTVDSDGHILTVPYGLLYREVTAASLLKLDPSGQMVSQGTTGLSFNRPNFMRNVASHTSRNDLRCVIYLYRPSAVAVSSMDCGLLPLSQDAMSLGDVKSVDVNGGGDVSEEDRMREAFGPRNKVALMRNAGVIVGGESVEEAFHIARSVMNAIDTQLRTMPLGLENILLPSEEIRRRAFERANKPPSADGKRRWMRGELEFEALMRHLENSGYKTGYTFHAPLTRQSERLDRVNSEVEVPPASTSFAYGENDLNSSALKEKQKKGIKTDWLNSPNAYKKEEFDEKGAPHPKKITRWIPDSAPGSLIKIENPNQFAPVGTDPKELKAKFREIRKDHFDDNITAGPQSRILEGVTWEEAQKIKEGHVASDTIIVVGAASRGIIKKEHQTTANVYKTYYAPNPFDNVTDEDVEQYKAEIGKRTKRADSHGLTTEEEDEGVIVPGPDGRLISSDERMQQVRQTQAEGRMTPEAVLSSPAKSTSSGEGLHGDPTSETETGTGREQETPTPVSGGEKKKKKRGFRMPSFSSKKKEKQ